MQNTYPDQFQDDETAGGGRRRGTRQGRVGMPAIAAPPYSSARAHPTDQTRDRLTLIPGSKSRSATTGSPSGYSSLRLRQVDVLQRLMSAHGLRFLRYTVVGGTGVLVNTVLLYLLVTRLGLNHLVAAAISSEVSILTNFALNDVWTFRDNRAGSWWIVRAAQYNAVALGGMVISLGVLAALTMGIGLHYLIANLVAIAAATLSNYALNSRFTWAVSAQPTTASPRLTIVADA